VDDQRSGQPVFPHCPVKSEFKCTISKKNTIELNPHVTCAYFVCVSLEVFKLAFQLINELQLFLSLLFYFLVVISLALSTNPTRTMIRYADI